MQMVKFWNIINIKIFFYKQSANKYRKNMGGIKKWDLRFLSLMTILISATF